MYKVNSRAKCQSTFSHYFPNFQLKAFYLHGIQKYNQQHWCILFGTFFKFDFIFFINILSWIFITIHLCPATESRNQISFSLPAQITKLMYKIMFYVFFLLSSVYLLKLIDRMRSHQKHSHICSHQLPVHHVSERT